MTKNTFYTKTECCHISTDNITLINTDSSSSTTIKRNTIEKITFKGAIAGFRSPQFEIVFNNENGRLLKQTLVFSSQAETEQALRILGEAHIIVYRKKWYL